MFSFPLRFRIICQDVTQEGSFDFFILIFIAGNCITLGKLQKADFSKLTLTFSLAMERPTIPPWSTERLLLDICNHIFTVVFTIEMAMKAVAYSLIIGERCYFSDNWNRMDGTLVIVGIVDTLGKCLSFMNHITKEISLQFISFSICWKSK